MKGAETGAPMPWQINRPQTPRNTAKVASKAIDPDPYLFTGIPDHDEVRGSAALGALVRELCEDTAPPKTHKIRSGSLRFIFEIGDAAIIDCTMLCCIHSSKTGHAFRRLDGSGCELYISDEGMAGLVAKGQVIRLRRNVVGTFKNEVLRVPQWTRHVLLGVYDFAEP